MESQYSLEVNKLLKSAENIAYTFNHSLVGSEHLLVAILNTNNVFSSELKKYRVTYDVIYKKVRDLYPSSTEKEITLTHSFELKEILKKAKYFSIQYKEKNISLNSLILSLIYYENSTCFDLLKKYHINYNQMSSIIYSQMKRGSELLQINDLHPLDRVKKDPLIGREKELKQLIMALSRRNKPNAILIGEPGVGKTAIVEELALKLANGEVKSLENKMIYELDLAGAIAGTKYRGEFEEKIKKILKKVIDDGNAILFIDEIHNIIKAGGAEGAIDASNILKPYLSRGDIKLIGATTEDEYRNIFEKDKALKRRFQTIKILQSSKEETKEILRRNKHLYEEFYKISINDECLDYIVDVADRYLTNYYFPDKAIDILDNSCASVETELTLDIINKTVETLYKVKICLNNKAEETIENIKKKICGHEDVLNQIKNNLIMIDKGIYEKDKPILSMMFLGPSGVGKTTIANIIGDTYFDAENALYLNMSCYQDAFGLSKLVAHSSDNTSSLVRKLKMHPKSILIIDEIEKASNEVLDLFLTILDQGFFESSKGEKIDCTSCMAIFISNYGYNQESTFKRNITGYVSKKTMISNLQNRFRYEFLSRIDDIVVFSYIDKKNMDLIARNYFKNFGLDSSSHEIEEVLIHSEEDYNKFGVRLIQKDVKTAILNNLFQKIN